MIHASICNYENILPATLLKRLISTELLILYIDIMPVITFFIPGGAWEETTLIIGPVVLLIGHFVAAIIDFLIIAVAIFWIMKVIEKTPLKYPFFFEFSRK